MMLKTGSELTIDSGGDAIDTINGDATMEGIVTLSNMTINGEFL